MLDQLFRPRRDHRSPRRVARRQRPVVNRFARAAGFEPLEGRALLAGLVGIGFEPTLSIDAANTSETSFTGTFTFGSDGNVAASFESDWSSGDDDGALINAVDSSGSEALTGSLGSFEFTATNASAYVVDFEDATKISYASGTVTLNGIDWNLTDALIGADAADWKEGSKSVRMRGYSTSAMTMLGDKSGGAGTFSFQYRRYGSDIQVAWKVQSSTDGGSSWVDVGAAFTAPASDDVQTFSETLDIAGDIRFRIIHSSGGTTSNRRLNIDNITITNFAPAGVPLISRSGSLAFFYAPAGEVSAAQLFSVSGSQLTDAITATAPAGFEVSTDGSSFGPTATIPEFGGSASGSVFVRIAASNSAPGPLGGDVVLTSTVAEPVNVAVSGIVRAAVISVPYSEDFATSRGDWFPYSVAGSADWGYVETTFGEGSTTGGPSKNVWQVNGFLSDVTANDWLVLGPVDLSNVANPAISFNTLVRFPKATPQLSLKVSTDFNDVGDPSLATWTPIEFPRPSTDAELIRTPSGQISLAAFANQPAVFLAFHYLPTGTSSADTETWQIDDVAVFNLEVPALNLVVPAAINEGSEGVTGTVTIPVALAESLEVTITSSDANRLLLRDQFSADPAAVSLTVTIPAGQTSAAFLIDTIRDFRFGPDETVTLSAAAADNSHEAASWTVTVRNVDPEPALLTTSGYTQDFATFVDQALLPTGWAIAATGNQLGRSAWGSTNTGVKHSSTTVNVFGYQHTSTTGVATQTLTLQNDTGGELTAVTISYVGRSARDEARIPTYTVTVDGQPVPALAYSTGEGDGVTKTVSVTGLAIPADGVFQIVWTSDRGESSGTSRTIGISEVSVTAGATLMPPSVSGLSVPLATIARTTAVASANVTSDGGAQITERGFVLLATALLGGELTIDTPDVVVVSDAFPSTGPMTADLTGLVAGTSYTVRAFATNSEGTAYTSPQTFISDTLPASLADGYSQTFADYTGTLPAGWKAVSSGGVQGYGGGWNTESSGGFRGVGATTGGVLGYQHVAGSGTLTVSLSLVNDTGSTIDTLNVSYLGRVARVTQTRFPAWTVAVNGVVVPDLAYSTDNAAGEAGAAGDQLVSAVISGLGLAPGAEVTITWESTGDTGQTTGSSRQIGIGDVQITAEAAGLPVISKWNFDAAFDANLGPIAATTGTGSARLIGGTTHVTTELNVWRVTTFPGQSLASGTAGVEFLSSTVGRQDIVFSFEQYGSGTASRWAQVDYTVDGGATWVTGFWNNQGFLPDGPYTPYRVDFSSVAAANDNPDFGVRIVSIFSPLAFNENSVISHLGDTAYMRVNAEATYPPTPGAGADTRLYSGAGNWRFDNVTFAGNSLPATTPSVSEPTAAGISTVSARLGGTVDADGFAAVTARGIVVAPASFVGDLVLDAAGVTVVPAATAELGAFVVDVFGLTLDTAYRFRAYATNAGSFTGYSAEGSFQTRASLAAPEVSAPTAADVAGTTATLGGTIDGDGGSSLFSAGIVFSDTLSGDDLIVGGTGVTAMFASPLGVGEFTVNATFLSELTSYNFRVFASNAEGTSYSATESFTTAGSATVATTPAASGITSFTATLAGTATAGSDILERGFVLAPTGVNATPTLGGTGVTQVIAEADGDSYSAVASRLSALTSYSFRAYATTAAGTTYGDVASFATAEGPIAFWDFAGTNGTAGGAGTASLVGGTNEHSTAGAWRVDTFPTQGAGSGTAGVQFLVPTVGYSEVVLSFDHYASNTGSRWAQLDYTLDGGQTWTTGFWNNAGGTTNELYYSYTVDFTSVAGAANNPDFGVRIVSIFSPIEFNPGVPNETFAADTAYHRARLTGGSAYAATGNWRFQNVTFTGTALTAQAPILTVAQPTVIKGTSATLGGAVVSGGGRDVTARGVLVAAADFGGVLEVGAVGVSRFDATAGGLGEFTADATGLDLATAYVYRAFATNADGLTGYSETLEFTTLPVDLISTTTTLDAFPARATFGTPVSFTGTVSAVGSAQTPSGTIEIRAGGPSGTLLASASVAGDGTYSAASSAIAIGTYSGIAAYFLVGGTFDGSASVVGGSLTIDPRAFTPGNLLVLRVGDGTTKLGVNADAVMVVEFTPDGTLVQEIPVAAAGEAALTLGTNPNNGILSLAADRQSVTFGGYRAAAGSANPVPANVPRVIGSVGADGTVDTSRGFAGVFTSEDFRSVATDDGSNFWLSGAGLNDTGGVRHVTADGTSVTGLLASPPANPNMRQVLVVDGNLFTASGSNPTGRSIYQVGTGLPTEGGQPLVNLPPIGGSSQWQSFFFADLDPAASWGNTGFDTIYATDFSAITKLSYVAGDAGFSWVDSGSVLLAGASGITGFVGGDGSVTLYVSSTTENTGGISTIIDSSGPGGSLSATAANINSVAPVAAGANYAFRGLAFVPRAGIETTTTITGITSATTADFLQEVTFSAQVVAASGSDAPTGVVQFRSGNVLLATAALSGTSATITATFPTGAVPFGTYTEITARYIPDGNASANLFNPSVSAAFEGDLVIEPQGDVTTTVLSSITPLTAAYGDTVTFAGTVTGDGAGTPSGTIEIRAGGAAGTLLASGDVVGGSFSVSSDTIVGGSYAGIVAVFAGVTGFQNSVSAPFAGTLEVAFTQLGLGDIAFMGFQPAAPDAISFVLLQDVIAGTTLTITDKAWDGSALGASEGTTTITFTQAFSAGTVFEYLEYDQAAGDIDGERWAQVVGSGFSTVGLFDVTSSSFGMSTGGDNLFAYQGAAPTSGSASNWIAGFSTRPFLTEGSTSTQTSYLPAALATGNAAFSLGLAAGDPQGRRLADLGTVSGTPAQIRATIANPANWVVTTSSADDFRSGTVFTVDQTPEPEPAVAPQVTGLFVRGSSWENAYLDLEVFTTVDGNRLGWQLPDGAAQLANASAVSWVNVDTVSVRFSEPVQLPAVDAMQIVRGNPNGNSIATPVGRELLAGGTVVQWTFAEPLANGRYFVSIPSAGVTNAAGTAVLDGEWVTGESTFADGSGDGTAGGIFNFAFMVLRGNVSGQGSVQVSDVLLTRTRIGSPVTAENFQFGIFGLSSVTVSNFLNVRSQVGASVSGFTDPTPPTEADNGPSMTGFSIVPTGFTGDADEAPVVKTASVKLMAESAERFADTPVLNPTVDSVTNPVVFKLLSRIPTVVADSPAAPESASVAPEAWAWFAIESEQQAKKK